MGRSSGQDFYDLLDLPWLTDLAAQQRAGGEVTWATGEVPLFVVIIALVAQWFIQDQREARRKDRAADTGHDDSLAAYNEMLAALAGRDRVGGPSRRMVENSDDEHDGDDQFGRDDRYDRADGRGCCRRFRPVPSRSGSSWTSAG